ASEFPRREKRRTEISRTCGPPARLAERLVANAIPRSRRRRGISYSQSEIPRCARNDTPRLGVLGHFGLFEFKPGPFDFHLFHLLFVLHLAHPQFPVRLELFVAHLSHGQDGDDQDDHHERRQGDDYACVVPHIGFLPSSKPCGPSTVPADPGHSGALPATPRPSREAVLCLRPCAVGAGSLLSRSAAQAKTSRCE